ncbi:MAG TPA: DUF3575 domain-containing protein [Prolixibacteraceae bacterium]|nr:DUF3575 domain-containing protein [Prolixibacteraceae bacterium]
MKPVLLSIILLVTLSAGAQENIIKLDLSGIGIGSYALNYERQITDNNTINIKAGYWNMNAMFFNSDNAFGSLIDYFDTGDGISLENIRSGFHTSVDYRFYAKTSNEFEGVYFAPYLRYWEQNFDMSDFVRGHEFDVDTKLSSMGFGIQMGYQWVIKEKFIVDWYFVGLGLERYRLKGDYITDQSGFNYSTIEGDVKQAFMTDYEFLNKRVKVEPDDERLRLRIPVWGPGIKTGLSVGYRF